MQCSKAIPKKEMFANQLDMLQAKATHVQKIIQHSLCVSPNWRENRFGIFTEVWGSVYVKSLLAQGNPFLQHVWYDTKL